MKINDFFDRKPVQPRKVPVFNLSNEFKEEQLEGKIVVLEKEIKKYADIQSDIDLHKLKLHGLEEDQLVKANVLANKDGSIQILTKKLEQAQKELDTLRPLVQKTKEDGLNIEALAERLENLYRTYEEVTQNLGVANENLDGLKIERTALIQEHSLSESERESAVLDLRELKVTLQTTQLDCKDLDAELSKTQTALKETKDGKKYWEDKVQYIQVEINKQQNTVASLKEWVSKLEKAEQDMEASTIFFKGRAGTLEETILSLQAIVEDLSDENLYLTDMNTQYKEIINRPRFMSQEAISKQEGFKMPLASSTTNYRKSYLGTQKPTLLKLKKESV